MIVEAGLFRINRARVDAFATVATDIRAAFARGEISGLRSFHLAPAIEDEGRWTVLVAWDSLSDHERFVASDEGERQRVMLGRFMLSEPEVFHVELDDVTEGLR